MLGEIKVKEIPDAAPVAHHEPTIEVEEHARAEPVRFDVAGGNAGEQTRLQQLQRHAAHTAEHEAHPVADGVVGRVEVHILQSPRAAPVQDCEREEDEEAERAVDARQHAPDTRHRQYHSFS